MPDTLQRRLLLISLVVLLSIGIALVPYVGWPQSEDNGTPAGMPFAVTPGTPSALLPPPTSVTADQVQMVPGTVYDTATCGPGSGISSGQSLFVCALLPTPTPIPTDTPIPVPTDTPTPTLTPTATPQPTDTPLPTSTPMPAATATPIPPVVRDVNGTPLCGVTQLDGSVHGPAHDPTMWHGLLERNPDGSILCTYGHEHGADPATGDPTFGPLPLAQQISYPWATVSSAGVGENTVAIKHRVYKWLVGENLPCGNAPDGTPHAVTALRLELHADGNLGAAVRFHSFWGQFQLTDCATGDQGTVSIGGHQDYAHLTVDTAHTVLPLSNDPPAACILNGDSRQEGLLGGIEQGASVWYGSNEHTTHSGQTPACDDDPGLAPHVSVAVNVTTSNWGPVDPANPSVVQFYPDRDRHTGTATSTDAVTIYISRFPVDATGHVNFDGHANRHGVVVPEVIGQAEGPDYIPLQISNALPRAYGSSINRSPVRTDGDVPGPQGQPGYYVETPH